MRFLVGKFFVLLTVMFLAVGCSKTFEAKDPIGAVFPNVRAKSLAGNSVMLPAFFDSRPVLLLIGYVQDSQFDIDRWLLAIKQLQTPIEVAELPTIQGLFPRLIAGRIDQGMRNGIPEEDWKIVFTVYKDAEQIAKFLGNSRPRNARVVLLDYGGKVIWFHDRGFSADKALELDKAVREQDISGL